MLSKFCLQRTNNKTDPVDLSMKRKNNKCKDKVLEMKATNKFTNDFIRNNAKNIIGKTCFIILILLII